VSAPRAVTSSRRRPGCCRGPEHAGREEEFAPSFARKLIDEFEDSGSQIIISTAGCRSTLKGTDTLTCATTKTCAEKAGTLHKIISGFLQELGLVADVIR